MVVGLFWISCVGLFLGVHLVSFCLEIGLDVTQKVAEDFESLIQSPSQMLGLQLHAQPQNSRVLFCFVGFCLFERHSL